MRPYLEDRHQRTPIWSEENLADRRQPFTYAEPVARDELNLDVYWLRDESLEDTADLPEADLPAAGIVEDSTGHLAFSARCGIIGSQQEVRSRRERGQIRLKQAASPDFLRKIKGDSNSRDPRKRYL